jgi:acetoin utilization protein AcuB
MRWNGIHLEGPIKNEKLRILKAEDVMHTNYEHFNSKTLVKDIVPMLSSSAQKGFPVTYRNRLVGVVTQTDLSKFTHQETLDELTVAKIMTPHPVAVNLYDSLDEISFLFSHHKFTWLPVVSNNKLKGIIMQSDLLNALFEGEEA